MKNNEKELKEKYNKIVRYSLAIESYLDNGEKNIPEIDELINEEGEFYKNYKIKSLEENLSIANDILEKYNKLISILGKEKFIIYDDGDIEYNWKS